MIYEVQAKILFSSQDEANDFYNDCSLALPKGGAINTDDENMEFSQIALLESNHEKHPPEPSVVLDNDANYTQLSEI